MGIKKDDILTLKNLDKDQIAKWNAKFGYTDTEGIVQPMVKEVIKEVEREVIKEVIVEIENPEARQHIEELLKERAETKKELAMVIKTNIKCHEYNENLQKQLTQFEKDRGEQIGKYEDLIKERVDLRNKIGNLAGDLLEKDDRIVKLKDKLADSLNAEQEAKKLLEDLKKKNKSLLEYYQSTKKE